MCAWGNVLVQHLVETQPGHVPAPIGIWILHDAQSRLAREAGGERVAGREAAELGQEIGGDVVGPCCCHGPLEGAGFGFVLGGGCYALDAAELGQGVDAVGLEGFDELVY